MTEVYAYSKAKDGSKPLSANFTVGEFACRDGSDVIFVAPKLIMVLQCIRSYFNAQTKITSGYRTPHYKIRWSGVRQTASIVMEWLRTS